ncbi:AAA+ ATPase domain-containing protein [Cynara cardunculus var. scolymus]|uniref:AAA+ ATPase domain-containing protein n=1 Tax=Cynara cardunculus var. scolymus TaxID=59895 RepID=A0A103YEH5_CYNCS|nr:AAA+ ATPase domain-containing protein [Cynara cardunculus var. scolymus]
MRKVTDDEKQILNDQPLPFSKLLSYADGLDYTLMALASLGSIIHGLAQPLEVGGWMYASERQVARLRLAYLKAVLKQEIGAFDTELTNGKIITGISNHMGIIQDAIGEKLGHFISCFATFFTGVVIAFISCWEVSLLTLFVVPMILMIGATYTKKMNSISATKTAYLAEATVMVEQTISQIRTVFAFVGESSAIKSFSDCMQRQLIISKGEALIKGVGTGVFQTVTFCSWALIVWIGALVVVAKRAQGGDVIAAINGNIEIRGVHFAYPSRQEKLILQGFSLSIPAGKVVALVGSSGCGKSTIISLVPRFYDPEKGEVLVDNHNVKDLDLKFLRENIGAVSQEPALFAGTIKDNMKVGKKDADDEQIQIAATMANAHAFISQLPNQYLTDKQRIAIARAILKNPPILLLDEATSALDSASEKLVQDALESAMKGRTVILIAHRMSTIVNADMIVVVQNGQVTETGTHSSLLQTKTERVDQQVVEQVEPVDKHIESNKILKDAPKQEDQHDGSVKKDVFFRIWFGLNNREFVKIGVGSCAAAFSGISKPVFGFFIITIGVAYYKHGAKEKVGWYSLLFSAIAVLRNELAWFDKPENSVGSLTSRIINETSTVKTIISDRMAVIVQCISSILIATIVSMIVNWRMGLVAWAVMPCHFIGGLIQAKSAKGFSGDTAAAHSELVSLASESATNIKTVASFCHEEHILERAKLSLDGPLRKSRKQSVHYGFIQGVSLCLWNIAHAVALWYSTVLVEKKQASFEDGIRSYQIFSLTVPSITELWTLIPTVISAINVLTPVFQALDRQTEIEPDEPENPPSERIKGEIEFRNVNFTYPSRPEVTILDNFTLRIEAGSKVALVGPSGAGKSSVLALLLRFYLPLGGLILIDGRDITRYNLRNLRRQIGLVQQEPLLFSCSIRDNICYGTEGSSESEVIEVSREANIHEFVSNLPDGYETVVGEKGCQLSGGQKQRIAIARTLLKNPAIMLLDEATSALDAESERAVVSAMESINRNGISQSTQITVAHRLSTVVHSDKIVVMEKGKVVEIGTHSALVAASEGIYSRFYRIQSMK